MFFALLLAKLISCFNEAMPKEEYKEVTERLDINSQATLTTITKSRFCVTSPSLEGGAICIKKSDCLIDDCKFEGCSSKKGGAICVTLTTNTYNFTVFSSTFNNCESSIGGAIYLENTQFSKKEYLNIIQYKFNSNKATTQGGAIYGKVRDSLLIQGCTFENNEATSGSSLWCLFGYNNNVIEDGILIIRDNTFKFTPTENNNINVHFENAETKINNTAKANVYLGGCNFVTVNPIDGFKHLEMTENFNGFKNIYFDDVNCVDQNKESSTISIPEKYELNNFTFSCTPPDPVDPPVDPTDPIDQPDKPTDPIVPPVDPTDPIDQPDEPSITPDPSYQNRITERYNDNNETISRENTEFYNIKDDKLNGGAIYIDKNRVSCTLKKCKFTCCKGNFGGAIYIQYAGTSATYIGTVTNTVFDHCIATKDGGAVYLKITQPKLHSFTFDGCSFISNSAGEEGGAIYATARDQLTITNCLFNENVAKNIGSSIYCEIGYDASKDKGDTLKLIQNTFLFTPTESSVNVYIQTNSQQQNINAVLELESCKFATTTSDITNFFHLQLNERSSFESIKFEGCNCVQQGFETLSVPKSAYPIDHFMFNCNDQCTPDEPIQPPPEEGPDSEGYTKSDRIEETSNPINLNMTKFPNLEYADKDGAGIYAIKVSCNIINCKFISCKGQNGGAIYLSYTGNSNNYVGMITKTSFNGCESSKDGGAIYFKLTQRDRHSLTINDCTFEQNKAQNNGGAIYAEARDLFTVMYCKFNNNEAVAGSSIWCNVGYNTDKNLENNVIVILNTFIFSPKESSSNVYFRSYKYDSTNEKYGANAVLTFSLNSFSAQLDESVDYKHIIIDDSEGAFKAVKIPDCICIQQGSETVKLPADVSTASITYNCQNMNSCGPDSDGYLLHDQIIDEATPVDVKDAKFLYHFNEGSNGGSISVNKNKVSCTINHCKFDSCKSAFGGAVYIAYSGNSDTYVCTITNSLFSNCNAENNGGALYASNTQSKRHSITITGCTFTNNEAKNGGAVYVDSRDRLNLANCVFDNNIASINGSSLWCRLGWNDRYNKNEASVKNNKFTFTPTKSSAKSGPSNVYISSFTLNNDVTPNANLIFGGNTFVAKESTITTYKHLSIAQYRSQFESIQFSECNCVAQGSETVLLPTIYKPEYYFSFDCQDQSQCKPASTFTPTPLPDSDGYITSGKITRVEFDPKLVLSKVKFNNLAAEENVNGGAMYINCVTIKLSSCIFESCSSNLNGGGIYLTYSRTHSNYTCTILNTLFNNCQASNGSAISFAINQPKRHYVTIEQSNFTNNKASKHGGALYCLARDCLTVQQCKFINNEAEVGSSIWCRVGQDQSTALDPNDQAVFYGNTFSFSPNENNLVNVYIESNKLSEGKDANANVYIGKNQFTVNSNYPEYNNLKIVEVGAFQSIQFNDCNCIQGDESTVSITVANQPDKNNLVFNCQNIDQCPVEREPQLPTSDKCPNYSGRKESYGQSIDIEKTCFTNLVAPLQFDGGAIRVLNAQLEVERCDFTNCSSNSNGGAIYVTFSSPNFDFELEKTVFESCFAGKQGGAVYFLNQVSSCESSIKESHFKNNRAVSGAGAFYYSPCANSEMKKNLFINNTCIEPKAHGSSLYAFIENREINSFSKKKIKDDDGANKPVIIEGNRFRSEPAENTQQLYINLKKTGHLELNTNAFSFNKAEEIPKSANYIYLSKDEDADLIVKDDICVDSQDSHVYGFDFDVAIDTDCHDADPENDHEMDIPSDKKSKKNKTGLIVGIVVAVVVVIVIIVVVVVVVRKKATNKYVKELNDDEIADNLSVNQGGTEDPSNL